MTAENIIALLVLSNSDVYFGSDRICARSSNPQRNAGRVLKSMGIKECVVHFRRYGRVVRSVLLSKLLDEDGTQ